MALVPNNWVDEEKETFAEEIASNIVGQMSLKEKDRIVWDILFEEMMTKQWPDLWMEAEVYAPHLVESLHDKETKEVQQGSY